MLFTYLWNDFCFILVIVDCNYKVFFMEYFYSFLNVSCLKSHKERVSLYRLFLVWYSECDTVSFLKDSLHVDVHISIVEYVVKHDVDRYFCLDFLFSFS